MQNLEIEKGGMQATKHSTPDKLHKMTFKHLLHLLTWIADHKCEGVFLHLLTKCHITHIMSHFPILTTIILTQETKIASEMPVPHSLGKYF